MREVRAKGLGGVRQGRGKTAHATPTSSVEISVCKLAYCTLYTNQRCERPFEYICGTFNN